MFNKKREDLLSKSSEMKTFLLETSNKKEAERNRKFDEFTNTKNEFLSALQTTNTEVIASIKEFFGLEASKKTFFLILNNFQEHQDELVKLLDETNEKNSVFLTQELRYILNLISKNKTIKEFEEKIKKAVENLEMEEITNLENQIQENGFLISEEVQELVNALKNSITANPNLIAEKLLEMKKTAKGAKPKK